jgi:Zn-finger protein
MQILVHHTLMHFCMEGAAAASTHCLTQMLPTLNVNWWSAVNAKLFNSCNDCSWVHSFVAALCWDAFLSTVS